MGKEKKHRRSRRQNLPSELKEAAERYLHRQKSLGRNLLTVAAISGQLDIFMEFLAGLLERHTALVQYIIK